MTSATGWLALASVFVLAGCTGRGTLKVDGKLSETSASLASPDSTLELGGGKLVVTRARVAVSEIELEGGDEDREAEFGPDVIELALDGQPTRVAIQSVEAGPYDTLGLEFRAGGGSGPFEDFGGAEPASILVDGSYQGNPFNYRSGFNPEAEFPLSPVVNVPDDGEATVGVTFDIGVWFTATDGSLLDPGNPQNREAIEQNIWSSVAARAEIETSDDD